MRFRTLNDLPFPRFNVLNGINSKLILGQGNYREGCKCK